MHISFAGINGVVDVVREVELRGVLLTENWRNDLLTMLYLRWRIGTSRSNKDIFGAARAESILTQSRKR